MNVVRRPGTHLQRRLAKPSQDLFRRMQKSHDLFKDITQESFVVRERAPSTAAALAVAAKAVRRSLTTQKFFKRSEVCQIGKGRGSKGLSGSKFSTHRPQDRSLGRFEGWRGAWTLGISSPSLSPRRWWVQLSVVYTEILGQVFTELTQKCIVFQLMRSLTEIHDKKAHLSRIYNIRIRVDQISYRVHTKYIPHL